MQPSHIALCHTPLLMSMKTPWFDQRPLHYIFRQTLPTDSMEKLKQYELKRLVLAINFSVNDYPATRTAVFYLSISLKRTFIS